MTDVHKMQTLIEVEESTAEGQREMAAARAEVRVVFLLRKAFARAGVSQRELAERMGVTEGRVSQVLKAKSGLKISTVARYLRALGYRFDLSATPAEPGVPELVATRRPRRTTQPVHAFGRQQSGTSVQPLVVFTTRPTLQAEDFTHLTYYGEIHSGAFTLTQPRVVNAGAPAVARVTVALTEGHKV